MATGNGESGSNSINVRQSLADFRTAYFDVFGRIKIDRIARPAALLFRWIGQRWGNGVDDFVLRVIEFFPRRMFDSRGDPLRTGSAANGGGTVDFALDAATASGVLTFLRVVSVGGLTDTIDVQLFRDAARTDEIYHYTGADPSTSWTERTPATLIGDDGSDIENRTVYGRITNNGAAGSTFDIEAVIEGI